MALAKFEGRLLFSKVRISSDALTVPSFTGTPELVNIDKSGANTAALNELNKADDINIEVRQCKYLNNVIEQDHRSVKQKMHQAKGFGEFHSAHKTLRGIELWRMLKKGQHIAGDVQSPVELFYALAA